jgi:predicted amidohydrolase
MLSGGYGDDRGVDCPGACVTSPLHALTIAVAQPHTVPLDVAGNARRHAALVEAAGCRVVVFPELSLTGYELADAPVVDPNGRDLRPLIEACANAGTVALVGAPVEDGDGHHFIAMLAVSATGVEVAYRKVWLGSDETARFHPGPGVAVREVDGWRLGLAICKDTSLDAHSAALSRLSVDLYVAGLVMHPDEAGEQDHRAHTITRRLGVPVAFASFAGPTGSGYPATAGRSGIYGAAGETIAQCGTHAGAVACATLPASQRITG